MPNIKRVFLIVLDSFGVGALPDAAAFGDEGSNTLAAVADNPNFNCPNLARLGLFNIDGIGERLSERAVTSPLAAYGRMAERSVGKDTTTGHFEISGIILDKPFPTYPDGFPKEIIDRFESETGRGTLCNKPYSGTAVIKEYGREHIETGKLIVYTSADSVFQIAAHESVVPREELYRYCKIARKILCREHAVGRVIARPFVGEYPNYTRTDGRHDFSVEPEGENMLTAISESGLDVIAVGKINDIFCGKGVTEAFTKIGNKVDLEKTIEYLDTDFSGLCFVNLVDFDSEYGHRNDPDGYARALSEFDKALGTILSHMCDDDCLILCADHGCDPSTESTDHSREYVPILLYGKSITPVNLGTRQTFADLGATVADLLGVSPRSEGESFAGLLFK